MISFDRVSVTYPEATSPTIHDVDLRIDEGELCLVVGRTGVGKSTLLGAINGLVPHFTGGTLAGRVTVDGRDTRDHPPRELADVVGVVGQDPLAGFVTDTVEEELAYGMEQLAIAPDVMRKRVEETLDLLGIAELRGRALRTLSGGQQQRVAIGSVLTAHPRILVLDEPTSALDPTAAEEVLAAVTRLVHDLGVTVVIAEHRLERVVQYADRVLYLHGDGTVQSGTPDEVLATSSVAPPVVQLGRLAGWSPLPLSVRDARRLAGPLRERLGAVSVPERTLTDDADPLLQARRVVVRYGPVVAVREIDLDLVPGQVVALMGRNGSGKSSLLWALQGSGPRHGGTVQVANLGTGTGTSDPAELGPARARQVVGLVPQTPSDLLYLSTVAQECAQADADTDLTAGTTAGLLERIVPDIDPDAHPRDLSEGQRMALVLAVQLSASPRVVLLDEPTRGLDYHAKERFGALIRELADDGHAVVISTHDVEFVAASADRVVVLAEGEIVADGPTAEVTVSSPAFAPQIAKIVSPLPWLTVREIATALGGSLQ
ncbi:MAG: ATP-binding cassette domain-containing protein [Actinomycetota bacterium]|nr:ATP-binding cassette domain-containing protein [Actinomycetota bacterium]